MTSRYAPDIVRDLGRLEEEVRQLRRMALTRSGQKGLRQVVVYTSNGTFVKANFPWLKRVQVRVQGAGGGGGGSATTGAGQTSTGGGGGGGGYTEETIELSGLMTSETVTVGTGGAGVAGAAGTAGGNSAFGAHSTGNGGGGGAAGAAATAPTTSGSGASGGSASGGDVNIDGQGGESTLSVNANLGFQPPGGDAIMGHGVRAEGRSGSGNGVNAPDHGGGGGGAFNIAGAGTTKTGGSGGEGIVVVELYA